MLASYSSMYARSAAGHLGNTASGYGGLHGRNADHPISFSGYPHQRHFGESESRYDATESCFHLVSSTHRQLYPVFPQPPIPIPTRSSTGRLLLVMAWTTPRFLFLKTIRGCSKWGLGQWGKSSTGGMCNSRRRDLHQSSGDVPFSLPPPQSRHFARLPFAATLQYALQHALEVRACAENAANFLRSVCNVDPRHRLCIDSC